MCSVFSGSPCRCHCKALPIKVKINLQTWALGFHWRVRPDDPMLGLPRGALMSFKIWVHLVGRVLVVYLNGESRILCFEFNRNWFLKIQLFFFLDLRWKIGLHNPGIPTNFTQFISTDWLSFKILSNSQLDLSLSVYKSLLWVTGRRHHYLRLTFLLVQTKIRWDISTAAGYAPPRRQNFPDLTQIMYKYRAKTLSQSVNINRQSQQPEILTFVAGSIYKIHQKFELVFILILMVSSS